MRCLRARGGARSAPAKRPRRERSSSAELVGVGPGRSAGPARTHARPVEAPLDEVAKKKKKKRRRARKSVTPVVDRERKKDPSPGDRGGRGLRVERVDANTVILRI